MAGFEVQCRPLDNQRVHVGNVYKNSETPVRRHRKGAKRVVEILGAVGIDGERGHIPQISTPVHIQAGEMLQLLLHRLGKTRSDPVADEQSLQVGRGSLHLLEKLDMTAPDGAYHRVAYRKVSRALQGPVRVGHFAVRLEMEPTAVLNHGAEQTIPAPLHQLQILGRPSSVLLLNHAGSDFVAVKKWVERWGRDEGRVARTVYDRKKAVSFGVKRYVTFDVEGFRHGRTLDRSGREANPGGLTAVPGTGTRPAMLDVLTLDRVREAADRIEGSSARPTPLIFHRTPAGRRLWLKAENLQSIGAFKIRGATNLIRKIGSVEGVVAHSSGNHAQAVARAAKEAGIPAVIVMPANAPVLKRARTEADGAEIIEVGNDSQARADRADVEVERRGWVLVPPYDHPDIAAGQGTAALEADRELGDHRPTRFYCPASGGGLLSGCATVLHTLRPDMEIVAVEPDTADDTAQSLAAGERVAVAPPPTIADGLRVRIPGKLTFEVLKARVHRAKLVSEAQIMDAMAYALRHLRMVLEPSGAVSLAAALDEGADGALVLLSGGNVSSELLQAATHRRESTWEARQSS